MIRHVIRRSYREINTHWLYISADDHIGHPNFDRKLWIEQHEEAKEKGAIILKFGDVFEAIPPTDWRHTMANDDYGVNDYQNALLQDAEDLMEPYIDNFFMFSMGNHEDKLVRTHSQDMIRDICRRLNAKRNRGLPPIKQGDYRGFFKITFFRGETGRGGIKPFLIYYYHGKGAGGEVTGGAITLQRLSTHIEADLIVTAHIHEAMVKPLVPIETVNQNDTYVQKSRTGIVLSTFKDMTIMSEEVRIGEKDKHGREITYERGGEIKGGYKAAFEEKFRVPKYKLGGCFIRLEVSDRKGISKTIEVRD